MTNREMQELSILLGKYQNELLEQSSGQEKTLKDARERGLNPYDIEFKTGIKAQFNHARNIKNRIDVQIESQIKTTCY